MNEYMKGVSKAKEHLACTMSAYKRCTVLNGEYQASRRDTGLLSQTLPTVNLYICVGSCAHDDINADSC